MTSGPEDSTREDGAKAGETGRFGGMPRAFREAADSLEKDSPATARTMREAAEGMDQVAEALGRIDIDELLGTLRDYGRRNPALLFGGAVLAGLILSRVMRGGNDVAPAEPAAEKPPPADPDGPTRH